MRYFLLLAMLASGCGEPSQPPAAPGGGGGPVNVTGVNGGTGGSDGAGGAGGAGGQATGACDNASDLEALGVTGSVRDVARDCGVLRCAGLVANSDAYEACISSCVENDVQGLSGECAGCYGSMERCGFDSFCQLRCRNDTCDPICLSCLRIAGCIEEFEVCRGLDGNACPE